MAWIEAHQGLAQHPKTKRLARMLNISTAEAIGHLFLFWWWAMDYADDGDLSKYDAFDIADAAQWGGDPEAFLKAMIECGPGGSAGFIEERDGGLFVHDWETYMGRLLEKREQNRQRQAKFRGKNADVTRDTSQAGADTVSTSRGSNALFTRDKDVSHALVTGLQYSTQHNQHNSTVPTTPPTPPSQGGGSAEEGAAVDKPGDKVQYTPGFEAFWAAYPRRVEKKAAFKAWLGIVRHGARPEDVAKAAGVYAKAAVRRGTPPDKLKHPATFLHEDRWRDWLPPDGPSYLEAVKLAQEKPHGRDSPRRGVSMDEYLAELRKDPFFGGEEAVRDERGGQAGDDRVCGLPEGVRGPVRAGAPVERGGQGIRPAAQGF